MKKIFKNVGGNEFKLLTESVDSSVSEKKESSLLREAIKKIFSQKNPTLNYKNIENMGLGFIKNVFEAKKSALSEARSIANECGYTDDSNNLKFVLKEDTNDKTIIKENWQSAVYQFIKMVNDMPASNPTHDDWQTVKITASEILQYINKSA